MRPLTEEESKALFTKLANYIGKNLVHLIDRQDEPYCFRLQKDRVFYVSESSMRLGISVARPSLISLGTCFGKFSKSGKFKLHITALDYLAQYAKYKVWIKPNGEMPFLYGNHVLKAHLGRITEDTPEHQGVVVFSMNDIPLGFGVTARSTVDTRKLDPTAIIVFHQAMTSSDPYSQWAALPDNELTVQKVEELLKPVQDDLWVAAACTDRIVDDATVQRSFTDLGIERTQAAILRCEDAYADTSHGTSDEHADENGSEGKTEDRRQESLVSHFKAEPIDAQLCRIRAVLLDRLDRLNTFVEICKQIPATKESSEDVVEDDWKDDPWAEETNEPSPETAPSSPNEPPISLSTFLTADLLDVACLLASSGQSAALRILMERHGLSLWPNRFSILDCVPEHTLFTQFRELLPVYDPFTDREQRMEHHPWRTESDFAETAALSTALTDCGISLNVEAVHQRSSDCTSQGEPLSATELTKWYQGKIDSIISSTGMIDAALSLVQHAASQGLPGLDGVGEELSLLSRLAYDAPGASNNTEDEWTLARWKSLEPSAAIHAYLARSTPRTVAKDIRKLVMPYLFVLESRAERAGEPDPSLSTRLLYEYILEAPLDIVAAVFEASKPTLAPAQRLIRNDEDMARLALACLYGSDSLNEWPTMSRIFECLPAWDTAQDEDEADEADTTIASLGTYVTPSTRHPRCTPADLMVFFKPLPLSSLSRALDVLDVHLESGEILERWNVPAPLRWFLQSNGSITEQRSWANRMARQTGAHNDKLESQGDWEWLLEDMLKLSESGDSGAWSAFCLLSGDDVTRIFFSGLLSTGRFDIAKSMLRSRHARFSMEPRVIEDICLTCSREFYENASSGNYHFGEMKLAYDCLDIPTPSEATIKEKEFIEATSRLCSFNVMSRPGTPITPLEIRLTKDRLSLISRVLSSNNDAYKHTQVILGLVHKLGFRGDLAAEIKTLAMLVETALQAEDFSRAYETAERMVDTTLKLRSSVPADLENSHVQEASEVCWMACFSLGRHPEFMDVQKKMILLGRALELCPADRLADILNVWYRAEEDDLKARRERLQSSMNGARKAKTRKRAVASDRDTVSSLTTRLQQLRMPDLHMPHSPLVNAPDAAAFAKKAFSGVAANFPFSVGGRGRTHVSEEDSWSNGSREGSRSRPDHTDVSAQATRVLQAGIGWLLGADEEE
ncbi:uncharacterized protein LAESUDRAFT_743648 [Laetiporus sulphureus 93-53]|uniref:PUA domain-containing protein n=1 Tax=Laetiporus sulphureus 93-53 TaxID=1314785 RepID=A0A165DYL7_9APHY|nr:uncharacterized protein LAESUDRAFT_743648 [Laetiporus sulphureus 93-53]KZT05892.1 hypothetical protein LAESUDRAFT_743648 [Laetiporus sulphureus 93-53]